jgi:hypothetical protein
MGRGRVSDQADVQHRAGGEAQPTRAGNRPGPAFETGADRTQNVQAGFIDRARAGIINRNFEPDRLHHFRC